MWSFWYLCTTGSLTRHLLSRIALRLLEIFEPYLVEQNRMANAQLLGYRSKEPERVILKQTVRVTNDHGCCPVFQILAKFSPNNQNQSVAGCSVFGFDGGEKFSGFRASGRDQALRSRPMSRPGPSVATKALSSPTPQMRGPHGRFNNILEDMLTPPLCH